MFQAMLWHDLRNPLNAVRMAASLLDEQSSLSEEDRRLVTQIRASAGAMNQLISDLIDLSSGKIRAGIPVLPADMDLGELCRQVAAETRAASPDRPVSLRTEGDLRGRWDPGRLRQVLSNLLGNAVHHGEGPIDLWATGRAPAGVELGVRNGGPPIPKHILPRLFDPLARARAGRNRRPGSLGLGLHIVREIVTGHGGSVEVESSPESGTIALVRLPRSPPTPDAP
jgi:signal transduction histidine kinase